MCTVFIILKEPVAFLVNADGRGGQCLVGVAYYMKFLYSVVADRLSSSAQQQTCSFLHNPRMASENTRNAIPSELCRYNNEELRIVMVGKTGVGKSATGNTILGKQYFKSKFSPKSLTEHCDKADGEVDGQTVAVIDTPGLFDTRSDQEKTVKDFAQCFSFASPGPHIFLVVIRLGRYTEEEKQTVQKIQEIFGEEADKYSMVLFTHGDLLKGEPIEEFLRDSEDLQALVGRCNGQYHVFNNDLKHCSQVSELLKKIRNITEKNGGSHYTTEMFQRAEKKIEEEKQRILLENKEPIRKEQEELEKTIKGKYEQQMREVKDDKERIEKLRAAREKELEEGIKILKYRQNKEARRKAEKSPKLLEIVAGVLGVVVLVLSVLAKFKF